MKTKDQVAFDAAKHGWSFANADGLAWRIQQCETIARRLRLKDPRHATLKTMCQELDAIQRVGPSCPWPMEMGEEGPIVDLQPCG